MMRVFFICAAFQASAYGSGISLMLSPSEEAALMRAQDKARKGNEAKSPTSLRLNGIIYYEEKSWIIWLNGLAIKPGEGGDTIRILKVTPEGVEVIWTPEPDQHYQVCLKPNEVFQIKPKESAPLT